MRKKFLHLMVDMFWYLLGSAVYAVAVAVFISPNEISPGGLTGISELIRYFTGIPAGILLMVLNLPILILGLIKFGGLFIIKTFIATAFASVMLTVAEILAPKMVVDRILACVFGGVLMGLGLSLVLHHGATTGGVDIIAKLINRRMPHLTVGKLILGFDGVVILLAAIVYRNIESALYSVIALYVSSRLMDTVLYGADKGKIIYIISSSPDSIIKSVNKILRRGVTVLQANGGYTGQPYRMLMCTVRRHEVSEVYRIIKDCDPKAFTVVSDAGEIIGEGFKPFT